MIVAVSLTEWFFRFVFSAAIAVPVVLAAYFVSRLARRDVRFSLRSLMIVATIVAITLGLCVYVIRK
jgi:cytochrome c biogenesis protein CcdA